MKNAKPKYDECKTVYLPKIGYMHSTQKLNGSNLLMVENIEWCIQTVNDREKRQPAAINFEFDRFQYEIFMFSPYKSNTNNCRPQSDENKNRK